MSANEYRRKANRCHPGRPSPTGDGVHLVAHRYKKGVRLDTHMHREAQLVYAANGTMQVTTPRGRWLVPPDRAVWVPARSASLRPSNMLDGIASCNSLYFNVPRLTPQNTAVESSRRVHLA